MEKHNTGRWVYVTCEINHEHITLINAWDMIMRIATAKGQCVIVGDYNLVLDPTLYKFSPKSLELSRAAVALKGGIKELGLIDAW